MTNNSDNNGAEFNRINSDKVFNHIFNFEVEHSNNNYNNAVLPIRQLTIRGGNDIQNNSEREYAEEIKSELFSLLPELRNFKKLSGEVSEFDDDIADGIWRTADIIQRKLEQIIESE